MSGLDIAIVIGYFMVLLIVGFIGSQRAKTSDDYLVAGRRLGYGMFVGCLCALLLGGASTIGTASLGYNFGISGLWLVTMLGLGIAFIGIFLVKKIFKLKVFTISQLLSHRFGEKVGYMSAAVSAVYAMMVCTTQIIAMGTTVQVLAGWESGISKLVVGSIVVLYTILGGMWAITLTDLIQFILIVIGIMFVMLPQSISGAGGFTALQAALPASYFNVTAIGWGTIIEYVFLYCLGAMVGQDIWQRFFTAKSVKVARAGGISVAIFALLYAVTCSLIGMCARVVIPNIEDTQLVFSTFAKVILPKGLLGIVLASVISVLMSTASGTLLASSSLISNDIIKPLFAPDVKDENFLKISRISSTVIGILSIVAAVAIDNVLIALDISYAILSGVLFFPIILGIFWKQATAKAALISIVLSTVAIVAGLAVHGISSTFPIIYGLGVSAVSMVLITISSIRR